MELEHLDVVSRCVGQTLTPQERSNLELGLLKRRATETLLSIRFWGRLQGESQDYLIAVALLPPTREYPTKKFYFCTNSSPELQQFPEPSKVKREQLSKLPNTRLKGDPTLLLADEQPNDDGSGGAGESGALTELDRLAVLVEQIDSAVAVVPLEAYVVSPLRQVIPNASFHGLAWDQATQLYNYFHFCEPELKTAVLGNNNALVRASDVFTPLVQDLDGAWVVSRDNTAKFVTLRNYQYPGAFFFHAPETPHYGFVYFGDGRANPDLAFML